MWIWIVLIGIIIVGIWAQSSLSKDQENEQIEFNKKDKIVTDKVNENNGTVDEIYRYDKNTSKIFITDKNFYYFILDKQHRRIFFATLNENNVPSISSYPFNKIISSSIVQDGETVSQSSHGIGRAIVGGVLAGGAGAIVGGMTSKKNSKELVKSLKLEIVLNDLNNPSHEVLFFNKDKGVTSDDSELKTAKENIKHWHNLITVIIQQGKSVQ